MNDAEALDQIAALLRSAGGTPHDNAKVLEEIDGIVLATGRPTEREPWGDPEEN